MSKEETAPRPQQVTMAAWAAGLSSAMMVFTVVDRLSRWQTVDLRQTFSDALSQNGLGDTLGLSLTQAMSLARVGLMVLAALAAATLVLAVFAARRDKGARIALTVIAVPFLLIGALVNFFLAGFVAAAAALLWSEAARDWFAGRAPRAATEAHPSAGGRGSGQGTTTDAPVEYWPPPRPADTDAPREAPSSPGAPTASAPVAPLDRPGSTVTAAAGPPPYSGQYAAAAPLAASGATAMRPRSLAMACVSAWVGSGMVLVLGAISVLGTVLPSTRASLESEVRTLLAESAARPGVDPEMVRSIGVDGIIVASQVIVVVLMLWAVAAMVLATLALRGREWARWTLLVSAIIAGLGCLVAGLVASPLLLVAVVCAVCVAMLLRPEVGRWYADRRGGSGSS